MLASRMRHVETNQRSWLIKTTGPQCVLHFYFSFVGDMAFLLFSYLHAPPFCGFQKLLAHHFKTKSCKFETSVTLCRFLRQCQLIYRHICRNIFWGNIVFCTPQYPMFGFISAELCQCLWILCKMG